MILPKIQSVLCSISTRGRYETTLPLAIQSVLNQSRLPNKLVIFDDNDEPRDMREVQVYQYLFMLLDHKGIEWEWIFAERKGQHYNHQRANKMGYEWVWRLDDDTVAEPNVLGQLIIAAEEDNVGAVGGAVLTPPFDLNLTATGKIENIYDEPNLQWSYIRKTRQEVDHLHCSFLYRAGVHDYDLRLSRVAHREETLFTYGLKRMGYRLLLVPVVTWHLKNRDGGIRDGVRELFEHDERIFRETLGLEQTPVVLDCGMGDHVVFKHVLPLIKNPVVFSCYPEIVPGKSIEEAKQRFGNLDRFNIYRWMDANQWTGSLEEAFKHLYECDFSPTR